MNLFKSSSVIFWSRATEELMNSWMTKELDQVIFRSTPLSQRNKVRPSIHPSMKTLFDFNEIWYVGRGR